MGMYKKIIRIMLVWVLLFNTLALYAKAKPSKDSSGDSRMISYMRYDKDKKSGLLALLMNIVIPGLGNMYAGGYITGTLLMSANVYTNLQIEDAIETNDQKKYDAGINQSLGILVLCIITAFTDVSAYNKKLEKKYGLYGKLMLPRTSPGIMLAMEKRF